jgi:hypothetical protein
VRKAPTTIFASRGRGEVISRGYRQLAPHFLGLRT